MRIVAAQGLHWFFSCLGIPYGVGIASVAHDHSCHVDSSDPPVCSMDSLEPPDEVPPGESALLQQVTVQMRKPFEPDDNLPENTLVLELADGHSGGGTVQPAISPKAIPKSSSGQARTASQNAALASAMKDQDDVHSSVSPSSVKASAAHNVAKQDDARSRIEHSPLTASSALHKPNQHATHSFDEPANVPGTVHAKNEFAVHSSIAPAPARTSAVPVAINRDVLHSSTVELMSEKAAAVAPVANKDAIDSLISTSKHRSHAETQKSESNKTDRHESLSLQVLVEDHMDHQDLEPGESKVNESKKELGLQASTRWLEMLHVGKIIQSGRGAISYETILLFVAMSIAIGCLIWGVVALWSSTGSPDHNEDQYKAPRVSSGQPNQHRPAYAQRSPENSAGSIQPHHDSGRLSAYPPVNQTPVAMKEPYREPPPPPAEMGSAQMAPMRALCPELIVPRGSECILVVHYLPPGQRDQVEFDILDINGESVLKVEVVPTPQISSRHNPKQMGSQRSRNPTIKLKSLQPRETTGGFIFAYCRITTKDDDAGSKQQNVYIYKEDDELYAHLMKDEMRKRYVLTSGHHGLQLLFEGNFEEHVVNVTNEAGERVAATEPRVMHFDPTKYYKLRVAANADVGLVLCGLLMINQMEFKS